MIKNKQSFILTSGIGAVVGCLSGLLMYVSLIKIRSIAVSAYETTFIYVLLFIIVSISISTIAILLTYAASRQKVDRSIFWKILITWPFIILGTFIVYGILLDYYLKLYDDASIKISDIHIRIWIFHDTRAVLFVVLLISAIFGVGLSNFFTNYFNRNT